MAMMTLARTEARGVAAEMTPHLEEDWTEFDMEALLQAMQPRLLALRFVWSIRLPEPPGEAECARCGTHFMAVGPTGHANDEPVCDPCLLDMCEELGMVLALVAVARAFASSRYGSLEGFWKAQAELGRFAIVYERLAARLGPRREFRR